MSSGAHNLLGFASVLLCLIACLASWLTPVRLVVRIFGFVTANKTLYYMYWAVLARSGVRGDAAFRLWTHPCQLGNHKRCNHALCGIGIDERIGKKYTNASSTSAP